MALQSIGLAVEWPAPVSILKVDTYFGILVNILSDSMICKYCGATSGVIADKLGGSIWAIKGEGDDWFML